ncbi:MAG: AraC family transcriptional regulator ligand-binding domain-containing protein [Pseudomonadota bacterium]|nr:AraC family transcriptional regulator ligand-binding domain-containing protein [Pseudomonadota bacterium]
MITRLRSPGLGLASSAIMLQQAEALSIPADVLLNGTGLTVPLLRQGTVDVTPQQELQMIANYCGCAGEPLQLGFRAGLGYQLASLGLLGLGILTSRDIRAAMLLIERYLASVDNITRISFRVERADVLVALSCALPVSAAQERFIIGRELGIIGALQDEVMPQQPRNVRAVQLNFPRLPAMDEISAYFACPVYEQADRHCFIGDAGQLQLPMPMANPVAAGACEAGCTGSSQATADNLIDKLRRLIAASLPELPDMAAVAGQLCMSQRTLGRHLEKEGWCWRDLVSECRLEKAEALLRQGQSVKAAAEQSGFSSASSFSHAFNRSRGITPGRFRDGVRPASC